MKVFQRFVMSGLGFGLSTGVALAGDVRDQTNIQTGIAQLVMTGVAPQDVAERVKSAVNQFAIPANLNFRMLPSETPSRPEEPTRKQVLVRGANAIEYRCENAYAEILKRPPPVNNAFAKFAEGMQVCLYNFQGGVKAYLIFTRIKLTESMTSGLFSGIATAIQGTDAERINKQLKEHMDWIREAIPTMLVERIEVPGMPLQEPDKAAVAALIPPKPPTSAVQPEASVPAAAPAAARAIATPMQARIEARKNLSAMGLTYHAFEQFIAAIRRKDDLAVQLFVDGGGIDLNARDATGKLPLEVAEEVGASEVVAIIKAALAPRARGAQADREAEAVAMLRPVYDPADRALVASAKASIPPDLKAKLEEIAASRHDLDEEQKQAFRDRQLLRYAKIKEDIDRVKFRMDGAR